MNFIKRNKGTIIAIAVFIVLVIILFQLKNIFFPNTGKAIYGNRLDGIDKVEISDSTYKEVENKLKEEAISNVSTSTSGKLVKIFITVNDDVTIDTAKSYGGKVLEPFTNEQKKFYDFQIYISKNTESKEFPIIGYKHHNNDNISWTKNR